MWFRLAKELGMSVCRAQAEITSYEFSEWLAFYELEPFGDAIADMRHGVATSVLANINRDPEKRRESYKPTDFIYWHESHRAERKGGAVLLDDKEAQSRLIAESLFGAKKHG